MKAQYTKDRAYRVVEQANGAYRLQRPSGGALRDGILCQTSRTHDGWDNIGPKMSKEAALAELRARAPRVGQ